MLTRVLCRLGVHRWRNVRNPDGEPFLTCGRCGQDGDVEGARSALRAGWWT